MTALSYCGQMMKDRDRDRFLSALFVDEEPREGAFALGALACELAAISGNVREEVIFHIRHAWWRESVAALLEGGVTRGHPVLEALAPWRAHISADKMMAMLEEYQNIPSPVGGELDGLLESFLQSAAPASLKSWRKARRIQKNHRARYGAGNNGWLALKLLFS